MKRITSCIALFVAISVAAYAAQGPGGGAGRMSAEERAALTKQAAPLAAKAIAQYVKLSDDEAKKFTTAYVAESEAAAKRLAEATGEGRMEVNKQNTESMTKVLEANLTAEQVKKAAALTGGFGGGLSASIVSLLRAKVAQEKVEKALPVLVKYHAARQELTAKMTPGTPPDEETMKKMTALRESTAKELGPIVGEEAAGEWQKSSMGGRGMRGGGGAGSRGGGQ
jgi:single-stranded DNA-specific DHH superfamily exonuclease